MASLIKDPNGKKRIQFADKDGARRTIRLGKMSKRDASSIKIRIEELNNAQITGGSPSVDTARWITEIGDTLYNKLSAAGLVQQRAKMKLGPYIEFYIASRTDVKDSTLTTYHRAKNKILEFFGEDKDMRKITSGDADDFARWLRDPKGGKLAEATARKTADIARQSFQAVVDKELINRNPFAKLVTAVTANHKRDYFISLEEAYAVLDSCPDAEWRLMFALARFGGLRCPSEVLGLRWEDIDWERNLMWVRSPKTEHHAGKEGRWVPIFHLLLPYLQDVYDNAKIGEPMVITRYQNCSSPNLRTQLRRIIEQAGLTPWPKLWQNLRSTRETELVDATSIHVASAIMGNSPAVAAKHYLQVTDEHYEQAMKVDDVAQNAAQSTSAHACTQLHTSSSKPRSRDYEQGYATVDHSLQNVKLGDIGLEPTTSRV